MTAALDFATTDDLCAALGRWLEDYGHTVHRQVPYPGGGTVDLLTPMYAVLCPQTLTPANLWAAVDGAQLCQPHFPDQRLVIAGLTPEEDWEAALAIAEQVQPQGIEVWFLDQMTAFVEYCDRQQGGAAPAVRSAFHRRHPLAGCAIALGMAAILSASFWLAYQILGRHQAQVATTTQESRTWEQLHSAVAVWDMDGTLASLDRLGQSRNPCVARFAERFETSLRQNGAEGFRDINPIKRALNVQEGCRLELQEFEFSQ